MEFEHKNVKNVYENIAINFSKTRFNTWNWIDDFIRLLPINSTILDVGCGNGRNMKYDNHDFYGLDNCIEFIKISKNISHNVILSEMTSIPFKNNYFDAILSIASFHHLSNEIRRKQCLKEMHRVLKPNCKLLLSVWSINQSHNKKLHNTFSYGNNIVPWKDYNKNIIGNRYYYIFNIIELTNLINEFFIIEKHDTINGNEIFYLIKK